MCWGGGAGVKVGNMGYEGLELGREVRVRGYGATGRVFGQAAGLLRASCWGGQLGRALTHPLTHNHLTHTPLIHVPLQPSA